MTKSLRGYSKVSLQLPGVSYWYLLHVHDWTAEQQIHHLFATLQLGGRHCLVGFVFSERRIDVC